MKTATVSCSAALKDGRVERVDGAGNFRNRATGGVGFFDIAVQRGGAFEVQIRAGRFALVFERAREGGAAGGQEGRGAFGFGGVFFGCAARKARRQAHLHFRVDAAGKGRIAADFDLAAAKEEKIQKRFKKSIGRAARGEWTEVETARAGTPRNIGARIGAGPVELDQRGRAETHAAAVFARPQSARLLVMRERLLERRAGDAKTNAAGVGGEIDALGRRVERAHQQAHAAAQVRRTQKQGPRRGEVRAGLDEHDSGTRGQRVEKFVGGGRVKRHGAITREQDLSIHGRPVKWRDCTMN